MKVKHEKKKNCVESALATATTRDPDNYRKIRKGVPVITISLKKKYKRKN
jgi:hypothetical protein